jgi:hypothetical protein
VRTGTGGTVFSGPGAFVGPGFFADGVTAGAGLAVGAEAEAEAEADALAEDVGAALALAFLDDEPQAVVPTSSVAMVAAAQTRPERVAKG